MKIKRIIALACSALILVTSLAGCKNDQTTINPNGEIEVSEEIDTSDVVSEQEMPVYDYKNLPASNELSGKEIETSYYARELSDRNKGCYDEIYNAALTFQTEVVLSSSHVVSPESLKKIMNIIYLDTPELYMLETEYSYDLDSSGNVSKIYLKYVISQSDYEELNKTIVQTLTDTTSQFKYAETEYDAELSIVETIESVFYVTKMENPDYFSGKNPTSSFFTIIRTTSGDHLAFAKAFSYYCKKIGIDSAVVVGELTNTDYAKEIGINIGQYQGTGGAFKETTDGTHVDVNIDYSTFYAWNIIKLNDKWYHVDVLFPKQWKEAHSEETQNIAADKLRTTLNVDDYTISQSRLFYVNEDILGLIPECNSKIFQSSYRNGNYFLNYTAGQINVPITQKIDELVENKLTTILYQFGSEETYDIFMKKFDQIIEGYNENNEDVIQNYRLIENKETLSVLLTDLIYY